MKHFVILNLEIEPSCHHRAQHGNLITKPEDYRIKSDNDRIPQYSTFMTNKYIKVNQNKDIQLFHVKHKVQNQQKLIPARHYPLFHVEHLDSSKPNLSPSKYKLYKMFHVKHQSQYLLNITQVHKLFYNYFSGLAHLS